MMKWIFIVFMMLTIAGLCNGGSTNYNVIKTESSIDIPLELLPPPPGYNAPEQVHITQGDHVGKAVIVSWVTASDPGSNLVTYWKAFDAKHTTMQARGHINTYKYCNYSSGYIHHATIRNLEYNTKYFYELGTGDVTRQFSFTTPPEVGPDVPYTFGIIGLAIDLGQTYDSNQTLEHYNSNPKGQAVLFVGDLSYADHYPLGDNRRWDSWARFVEKNVAYQPWIWTAGNHELDYLPKDGETVPFKPYRNRYRVPYKASKSTSPLWYSIKRASAHIIVLSSYSAYGKYTPQYNWLQEELIKVNRAETPWLIVLVHSPWYNSYDYHYMEGETMRVMFESWFIKYKVDIVLSGHVHGYERSERISNIAYKVSNGLCAPTPDHSAPLYITIGDGGNIEGHANKFIEPQPSYSAYRESSFGHGMLDIKNRTHAYFSWHRNQDDEAVVGDSVWLHNKHWFSNQGEYL